MTRDEIDSLRDQGVLSQEEYLREIWKIETIGTDDKPRNVLPWAIGGTMAVAAGLCILWLMTSPVKMTFPEVSEKLNASKTPSGNIWTCDASYIEGIEAGDAGVKVTYDLEMGYYGLPELNNEGSLRLSTTTTEDGYKYETYVGDRHNIDLVRVTASDGRIAAFHTMTASSDPADCEDENGKVGWYTKEVMGY